MRGERTDLNGPFLAREALRLGLEPARIAIVGDGAAELEAALREALRPTRASSPAGSARRTTTGRSRWSRARSARPPRGRGAGERDRGGLARRCGAAEAAVRRLRARRDEAGDTFPTARSRSGWPAPRRACSSRTARGASSSCCPARRRSCSGCGRTRSRRRRSGRCSRRTRPPGRRVLRFFGVSESAVARALADAGGDGDGVEATICARDFEIHVDLVVEPGAEAARRSSRRRSLPSIERWLYARDERPIEEHVLALWRARGLTLATAESCTGGMVAARLTGVPGASDVFVGGVVAYSDEVKRSELGVPGGAARSSTAPCPRRSRRRWRAGARRAARRGRRGRGDRHRRARTAGRRRSPSGSCYLHAEGPDGGARARVQLPGRPGVDPRARDRRRAPSRAAASDSGVATKAYDLAR